MKPLPGVAAPRSRQLAHLRSELVRGPSLLTLVNGELDVLAARCTGSVTARGAWLSATLRAVPAESTWAVTVRDGGGALRAAAVLLDGGRPGQAVSLAGCATGHRSAILAESAAAAALLGHALTESVAKYRPAVLVLGPVDAATPWLADFAATIPGAEIADTDPIPAVRRAESAVATDYLDASMRRTLRKAANRLRTDGREPCIRFTRDSAEIAAMIPTLQAVHRARNHGQGRASELDDPVGRRIWGSRIVALASQDQLEVATLTIDGRLAAQVIGVVEPAGYRVLEGFMVTEWSRYAAGRLLEVAVLQRFLDDPAKAQLDWMTAVAPESLLAANALQPVSVVRAAW